MPEPTLFYSLFIKWYKSIFGKDAPLPPNDETLAGLPSYQEWWSTQKFPTPAGGDISGMVSSEAATTMAFPGVTTPAPPKLPAKMEALRYTPPEVSEEAVPGEEEGISVYIPGQVLYNKATGEFLDIETMLPMSQADAVQLRNIYDRQMWEVQYPQAEAKQPIQAIQGSPGTYEEWRQRLLSELTEPRDWITRWQVANAPNPYTAQKRVSDIAESIRSYQSVVDKEFERLNQATAIGMDTGAMFDDLLKKEKRIQSAQALMDEMQATQPQGAPPAPGWLPQFVPGQAAGQQIGRTPVQTPSGQQWAKTAYSEREGLAGYAEYAGGRSMADILDQMAMMAPRTPATPTGWTPSRQRASI